jgi:hypothetical protein
VHLLDVSDFALINDNLHYCRPFLGSFWETPVARPMPVIIDFKHNLVDPLKDIMQSPALMNNLENRYIEKYALFNDGVKVVLFTNRYIFNLDKLFLQLPDLFPGLYPAITSSIILGFILFLFYVLAIVIKKLYIKYIDSLSLSSFYRALHTLYAVLSSINKINNFIFVITNMPHTPPNIVFRGVDRANLQLLLQLIVKDCQAMADEKSIVERVTGLLMRKVLNERKSSEEMIYVKLDYRKIIEEIKD